MQQKENNSIHSNAPFTYYFWIVISLLCIAGFILNKINFFYTVIMSSILALVFYYLLAQYACKFILTGEILELKYIFPYKKDIRINLSNLKEPKFELSYFYFLEDDFRMGVFLWSHPYDSFTFIPFGEKESITININSSYMGTKKLYKLLKNKYANAST